MQRPTRNIKKLRPSHVRQVTLDPCRAARSVLQIDGCGAATICRRATGFTQRAALPPRNKNRSKSFPQQCDSFCGVWAEIRFERESTKQRLRTVSAWPQYRRIVVQALAHRADRRDCARRGRRRTSSFAARSCSTCNTKPKPSAEWAERRTRTASRGRCVCVWRAPVAPHGCCARHSTTCTSALCFALSMEAASRARCAVHFRPTGGRRRAACTRVSAASCCASFPKCSAYCFSVCLHARGCAVGWLCGAAQRYPLLFWTAPAALRSSSSSAILSDAPLRAA